MGGKGQTFGKVSMRWNSRLYVDIVGLEWLMSETLILLTWRIVPLRWYVNGMSHRIYRHSCDHYMPRFGARRRQIGTIMRENYSLLSKIMEERTNKHHALEEHRDGRTTKECTLWGSWALGIHIMMVGIGACCFLSLSFSIVFIPLLFSCASSFYLAFIR